MLCQGDQKVLFEGRFICYRQKGKIQQVKKPAGCCQRVLLQIQNSLLQITLDFVFLQAIRITLLMLVKLLWSARRLVAQRVLSQLVKQERQRYLNLLHLVQQLSQFLMFQTNLLQLVILVSLPYQMSVHLQLSQNMKIISYPQDLPFKQEWQLKHHYHQIILMYRWFLLLHLQTIMYLMSQQIQIVLCQLLQWELVWPLQTYLLMIINLHFKRKGLRSLANKLG